MKVGKIFISLMLSAMLFLSVGCKVTPPDNSSIDSSPSSSDVVVEYSDTYLVKNGVSPYSIVIPNGASDKLKTAAEELKYFFSLSTEKLPEKYPVR